MANPSPTAMRRPLPSEYNQYYAGYVDLVPETDILAVLRAERDATRAWLERVPAAKVDYRYAPEKWTLRQVFGHVLDMEWIFAVRALHFARAVPDPMPGVEQDDAMRVSNFEDQPWADLGEQFVLVRSANILMFKGLSETAWDRKGIASGHPVTVRALAYILAGHQRHHARVIRERYLG